MKLRHLQTNLSNIYDLTNDNFIIIPHFFPLYDWGKQQIDDLVKDLLKSYLRDEDYFMGGIFSTKLHEQDFYIVEGMNRLTTLYYMLNKLQPKLDTEHHKTLAGKLDSVLKTNEADSLLLETKSGERKNPIISSSIKEYIDLKIEKLGETLSEEDMPKFIDYIIFNNYFMHKCIPNNENTTKDEAMLKVLKVYKQLNIRGKKFDAEGFDEIIDKLRRTTENDILNAGKE